MGQFEARKGRWSVYSDLVYFNLADDQSLTPVTEISSDLKQTVSLVMAGYKPKNLEVLDIYFGVRYDKVEIDLDLNGAIIDRGLSSSVDWIDPVVGVRARYPLNDQWSLESQLFYSAGKADYTVLANAVLDGPLAKNGHQRSHIVFQILTMMTSVASRKLHRGS